MDNDGDLDLIVNNINKPAFIYRNNADKQNKNSYLELKLEGAGKNTQGIGANVHIYNKGKQQYLRTDACKGVPIKRFPGIAFWPW